MDLKILYEDNHCIAVLKPHGMPVQGDASGDKNLLDTVKQFIKNRDHKPRNVFVGLLHRLDRPVGGVVLFAKTSKGASRLSEQFRNHTIEKTYIAMVEGKPKQDSGKVIQWLVKDESKNRVKAFDHEVEGSKLAELDYRTLLLGELERSHFQGKEGVFSGKGGCARVQIHPKTGRPHQIRVAMASLGCPIVGDKKYGAKTEFNGNIALFAQSLAFFHPVTKERIVVSVP